MLEKEKRLNRKRFDLVYETGRSVQTNLGYAKFASADTRRVACVVSKDECKKSVDRTRIRRRGYAVVEDYFEQIPEGISIIWFLPQTAKTVDIKELSKSFQTIIKKINQLISN